ncbi:hypothetical protein [Vibrio sp. H11]|uniref:hypothetical protein n=1 Tax=Vibrio sp. H11 TaxID=2565928 RepID=UPI0010A5AEAD|nr:hypothetical protein [Vibrio sp. H11]
MSKSITSNESELVIARCQEIKTIVNVLERANKSGDDVEKEIESGLALIRPLVIEIESLSLASVA